MPEINVQLRSFIAASALVAMPLTALADGGSIGFGGRIVDPTCTLSSGNNGERKMNCPVDQVVVVEVIPVGTISGGIKFGVGGRALRNAQPVNYRFQADTNVAITAQEIPRPTTAASEQGAMIMSFSYL